MNQSILTDASPNLKDDLIDTITAFALNRENTISFEELYSMSESFNLGETEITSLVVALSERGIVILEE